MKDTESNLYNLAMIVKRFPSLYFGNVDAERLCLWETVASTVRLEMREKCTVEEIKYKWKEMRRKYIYYFKKIRDGKSIEPTEYNLYTTLAFLYPYTAKRYSRFVEPEDLVTCYTDDKWPKSQKHLVKEGQSNLKTIDRTSIKTYGKRKNASAVDLHTVGEADDLGQSTRTKDSDQSTRSNDLGQSSKSYNLTRKRKSNNLGQSTISDDLGQSTRSDDLVKSTRSNDLGQSTKSDCLMTSTEEYSNAIKIEELWNETEDPTSSDCDIDMKPNAMESVKEIIKLENFPDDVPESTSLDANKTEENLNLQFFKSILPDIGNFTPQERRKFQMGVLNLINEIEENRK